MNVDKVDVVICHYDGYRSKLPYILEELCKDMDHIARIAIIKDGMWGDDLPELRKVVKGLPVAWMSHPKLKHGVAQSLNMGVKTRRSRWLYCINGGCFTPSGTIPGLLEYAAPRTMVVGALHQKSPWPNGPIVKRDIMEEVLENNIKSNRQWVQGRNGGVMYDGDFLEHLGGFDEEYCKLGYGLEDYDLSLRWQFGGGGLVWDSSHCIYQEYDQRPHEERVDERVAKDNFHRFTRKALRFYGGRVLLFADNAVEANIDDIRNHLLVGNDGAVDTMADCISLEWFKPGELRSVMVPMQAFQVLNIDLGEFIPRLVSKCASGCKIRIMGRSDEFEKHLSTVVLSIDVSPVFSYDRIILEVE